MGARIAVFVSLALSVASPTLAAPNPPHSSGYDSVDNGEIRYGWDDSKQGTAVKAAVTVWNALGAVRIVEDSLFTVEDLTWESADFSLNDTRYATWTHSSGADEITFNRRRMPTEQEQSSDADLASFAAQIAAHELGHALGIDDHYEDQYKFAQALMYAFASIEDAGARRTKPSCHDQVDYKFLWSGAVLSPECEMEWKKANIPGLNSP